MRQQIFFKLAWLLVDIAFTQPSPPAPFGLKSSSLASQTIPAYRALTEKS